MSHTSEKMSDFLAEIDQDLLDAAMSADTPEKLAQYKNEQHKKQTFYQKPALIRIAAVAACFAILVSIFAWLKKDTNPLDAEVEPEGPPVLQGNVPTVPSKPYIPDDSFEDVPPWVGMETENLTIQSVDMLYYYAAVCLLARQSQTTPTAMTDGSNKVQLLTVPTDTEPSGIIDYTPPINTEPPDGVAPPQPPQWDIGSDVDTTEPPPGNTEGPPVQPPTQPATEPEGEIYYYEIDPNDIFYISAVSFFRIELSGDGFLAGEIGTGIVDVVISNAIWGDHIITFKNGDNYFSCLTNGHSFNGMEFSTHKYIEGYNVVKNFRQENACFNVAFGVDGQIELFEECYTGFALHPVIGKTYVAQVDAFFTIDELESFFRNAVNPTGI